MFVYTGVDPTMAMRDLFKKFGLDSNAADFIGHAIALYRDDQWARNAMLTFVVFIGVFVNTMNKSLKNLFTVKYDLNLNLDSKVNVKENV